MAEIVESKSDFVGDEHQGVHNIMKEEQFHEVKQQPGLMVLDAYADWCGPCKMIAPKIVEFSKTYPDVRFYKLDVDEFAELSESLGIRAMPTILLLRDGEVVETIVGAHPKPIEEAIQKHK